MKSMRQPSAEREGTQGPRLENASRDRADGERCSQSKQRYKERCLFREIARRRSRELTLHARLGRQDKASCLAAGTSFLSVCLHIVFGRSPTFRRDERAALFPIIILLQCSESRRSRHAENRR